MQSKQIKALDVYGQIVVQQVFRDPYEGQKTFRDSLNKVSKDAANISKSHKQNRDLAALSSSIWHLLMEREQLDSKHENFKAILIDMAHNMPDKLIKCLKEM